VDQAAAMARPDPPRLPRTLSTGSTPGTGLRGPQRRAPPRHPPPCPPHPHPVSSSIPSVVSALGFCFGEFRWGSDPRIIRPSAGADWQGEGGAGDLEDGEEPVQRRAQDLRDGVHGRLHGLRQPLLEQQLVQADAVGVHIYFSKNYTLTM